jgi:hypothetical protein
MYLYSAIKKSEFHFLPFSYVFVTNITPFSRTFMEMSQLGDFKHGFTPIFFLLVFVR